MFNISQIKDYLLGTVSLLEAGLTAFETVAVGIDRVRRQGEAIIDGKPITTEARPTTVIRTTPPEVKLPSKEVASMTPKIAPFGVKNVYSFHSTRGHMFSTSFNWGAPSPKYGVPGLVLCAHSLDEWTGSDSWSPGDSRVDWPEHLSLFADDEIIYRPGGMDIVLFGVQLPLTRPPELRKGMPIITRGYPAGATRPGGYEIRTGVVEGIRPEDVAHNTFRSYYVRQPMEDDPQLPGKQQYIVVGGYSGSVASVSAVDVPDGELIHQSGFGNVAHSTRGREIAVGMVIELNGSFPAAPGQKKGANSFELIALADVYDAVKALQA